MPEIRLSVLSCWLQQPLTVVERRAALEALGELLAADDDVRAGARALGAVAPGGTDLKPKCCVQ